MALFLFTKAILSGKPIDVFAGGELERDFPWGVRQQFGASIVSIGFSLRFISKKCIYKRRERRRPTQYDQYRDQYDQDDQRHQPPFLSFLEK